MDEKKSSWLEEKLKLKPVEAKALRDLEELIGISIPELDLNKKYIGRKSFVGSFGVKIENEHVIDLRLDGAILEKQGFSKLTELPELIGNFSSLQQLHLIYTRLTGLPESIGKLSSLHTLKLNIGTKNNKLKIFPEILTKLSSLQTLGLWGSFTTLPESIDNLTSLQSLGLQSNQLISLPESIGNLTSLKELSIGPLTTLPESMGNLTSLENLRLGGTFTSLPESIGNLTSLKTLYCGHKLISLPDSIGKLTSLKSLYLGKNQFTTLPESICNLSSLQKLYLNNNRIEKIPDSIGKLTSLRLLYLQDNNLTTLPDSIGKLTSLHTLRLSSNKIEKIPESLGDIYSLSMCEVDDILLKKIPKPVSELKLLHLVGKSCSTHKQESNILESVVTELKENVLPVYNNGTYLERLNEEELRTREIEKKRRREELHLVEKALKDKQVKFVVSVAELEDIKKYALKFHQTQSEFIRTAIRDKIRLIDVQDQDLEKHRENQEDGLILEKLKKIQETLDRIESKEKTG